MTARVWLFGDNVDTDLLAPGRYMKNGVEELARHCLEAISPEFARGVRAGDVLVAGRNFGAGSSREQAVEVLRHLGIACVVAKSFAGLYYRNGFNLGLPLLITPETSFVVDGEQAVLRLDAAQLQLPAQGRTIACNAIPPHLIALARDGGLIPHLQKRLAGQQSEKAVP